jgi:hypothetical protein
MLNTKFNVNNTADERDSQAMSCALIPVWIRHNLECLDFCVDMLNDHPVPGKPFVICFFTLIQFMVLTRFFGIRLLR